MSTYALFVVIFVICCDPPLVDLLPDQSPDAIHDVALPETVQVRVDGPPEVTEIGDAERFTDGADPPPPVTVTVALSASDPSALLQVSVYAVVEVIPVISWDPPLVDLFPLHPPDATHEVAEPPETVQVRVD